MHLKSLVGKHVVITGGSSGIGLACAKKFRDEGATVTLIARNRQKLEEAKGLLTAIPVERKGTPPPLSNDVFISECDVSDPKQVKEAIHSIFHDRPIDVLICNAGIVRTAFFEDSTVSDIQDQIQTNLMGTIYPIHTSLPLMKSRGLANPSSIVIMCSLSGLSYWYGAATYTAAKYGQRGLAETLRLELLNSNIKISLICPNFTETPLLNCVDSSQGKLGTLMKIATFFDPERLESPHHIAECTFKAVQRGRFLVATQMPLGGFLTVLSRGFLPSEALAGSIFEALLASPMRLLSIFASKKLIAILLKKSKED